MTDVLAPFMAATERLAKQDATATPVASLLAYTPIAFGMAATVTGALRWLVGGTGGPGSVAGLSILAYAVGLTPDRLPSEERGALA